MFQPPLKRVHWWFFAQASVRSGTDRGEMEHEDGVTFAMSSKSVKKTKRPESDSYDR